ncbi:MAG: hypothetical protein ACE145_14920 [Terriglobia bacterium]
MKAIRNHEWLKVLLLAAFVACLAGGVASAQDFKGSFTLPFEARWGKAILPAGDYTFTVNLARAPFLTTIRGENGTVMVMWQSADSRANLEQSELILVPRAGKYTVRALNVAGFGTYSYGVSRGKQIVLAQNAEPVLYRRVRVTGK